MEPAKKKVLDESMRFLLHNVSMTQGFYAELTQAAIFTDEVLNIIRSKRTDEESISEMIGQLKRRQNDSFDKFLDALCSTGQEHIAEHLRDQLEQPSTDDNFRTPRSPFDSNISRLRRMNKDDLIEKYLELDAEYQGLNRLHESMLIDFEATLDENNSLHEQVYHLEHAQEAEKKFETMRERYMENVAELKRINDEAEKLKESQSRMDEMKNQLLDLDKKLNTMKEKRRRLASTLKLSETATDDQILEKIVQLKQSDSANQDRLQRMQSDLMDLQKTIDEITEQKNSLKKRHDFLSQQLRTLNLQKRRYEDRPTRNKPLRSNQPMLTYRSPGLHGDTTDGRIRIEPTRVNVVLPVLGTSTRRPQYSQRPSTASVILPPIGVVVEANTYCIVCRQEFHGGGAMNDQFGTTNYGNGCRIHYRAYRNGRYECCRNELAHAAGCLVVKHLYVDVRNERNTTRLIYEITDGSKVYANW